MVYIIQNIRDKSLFWSNDYGWTNTDYDIFDQDEALEVGLPIEGEWVEFVD